jgi:hypothetical protein
MGILMRELNQNKYYWVTNLSNTIEFKVQKLKLIKIIIYPKLIQDYNNYKCTYIFDSIEETIEVNLFNTDTKIGLMMIDNYIITDSMEKMLEILSNHIVMDYNKNHKDNVLDYNKLEDYISDIRSNHPELLI